MNNIFYALLVLFSFYPRSVFSSEKIKLGTYSLATESDWGAAFELKAKGVVIVTPWFTSGIDIGAPEKEEDISGTWKESNGTIELTFSKFKDRFKFEKECEDWRDYPCFRYVKSLASTKSRSPLNKPFPFINWNEKTMGPHTVTKKCLDQCSELSKKGELKKGMDINACAKELCK